MKKVYLNISSKSTDFHSIALKFRNLSGKIDELLNSGKFWAFSQNQQAKMLAKLRSLFEKLSSFNPKYALKVAGAAMCFTLLAVAANGQSFQEWASGTSPISFNTLSLSPDFSTGFYNILDGVFVDIDNDGDMDAFMLTESGPIFFENVNGVYTENLLDNPFAQCCGYHITGHGTGIDIADFDGDGDLDALIIDGHYSGQLMHYEMQSDGKFDIAYPSFINHSAGTAGSPLYLYGGYKAKFADVDGDGDLDIVGTYYCGGIATYIQQSNNSFSLNMLTPLGNPILFDSPEDVHINFADMDGDGDDDLFIFNPNLLGSPILANATGNITYYENTSGSGAFSLNTSAALLPLADMSSDYFPILADLDGDDDIDVFIPGGSSGTDQTALENLANNPTVPVSPFVALLAFVATGFGIIRKNRKKKKE
jgi:hypothetical protein